MTAIGSDVEAGRRSTSPELSRYQTRYFRAIEYRFVIEVQDPTIGSYLDDILASLGDTKDAPTTAHRYKITESRQRDGVRYRLDWQGEELVTSRLLRTVMRDLLWHINRQAIRCSQQHLLIHAAGVETGGQGIVMPAPQEAGKTTLSAALVKWGFRYLTDEAVAIDARTRRALAYPKPFSVDRGSWAVLPDLQPQLDPRLEGLQVDQWQVPPEALRDGAVVVSAPVGYVITPRYVAGSETRLDPLSRADAIRLLAEHAFNFRYFPAGLELLAGVVRGARCFRLTVGSLERACGLIEALTTDEERTT